MKRYLLYGLLILGASVILLNIFFFQKRPLPLENEKAYTDQVNKWLLERKHADDIAEQTKTPEKQAREEAYRLRLISAAQASVKEIKFYGKIVDQYGDPVPGVTVKYNARSGFLAEGTGTSTAITDAEGRFKTSDSKGTGLTIVQFVKPGYQFSGIQRFDNSQRFIDSVQWSDFTKDKPYLFHAWKIEKYPKVIKSQDNIFLLTPDGRKSTFDLIAGGENLFKAGSQEGDFTVSFNRSGESWTVRVEALDGGILESHDQYMNLAPESGYQEFLEYIFPMDGRDTAEKKYYIKMRNGKYYGRMTIEFRAYDYRQGKAAIFLSYIVNLENGRDLVVED